MCLSFVAPLRLSIRLVAPLRVSTIPPHPLRKRRSSDSIAHAWS